MSHEPVEYGQHSRIAEVLGAHLDVGEIAEEEQCRQHHCNQRETHVARENERALVAVVKNDGIEHAPYPETSHVIVGTQQVTDTIDEPQQRSLAVSKIDIGCHAVHPCLPTGVEPDDIVVLPQIIQVGVPRGEQYSKYCKADNC